MVDTSSEPKLKRRDIAYYRQRQKNRVFTAMAAFFAEEAEKGNITKKELANRLGRDPAQITRWLSAPSNFELDTLSDILLAMGAEIDHHIVRFSDHLDAEDIYRQTATGISNARWQLHARFEEAPGHSGQHIKPIPSGTDPVPALIFYMNGSHASR